MNGPQPIGFDDVTFFQAAYRMRLKEWETDALFALDAIWRMQWFSNKAREDEAENRKGKTIGAGRRRGAKKIAAPVEDGDEMMD